MPKRKLSAPIPAEVASPTPWLSKLQKTSSIPVSSPVKLPKLSTEDLWNGTVREYVTCQTKAQSTPCSGPTSASSASSSPFSQSQSPTSEYACSQLSRAVSAPASSQTTIKIGQSHVHVKQKPMSTSEKRRIAWELDREKCVSEWNFMHGSRDF